MVILKFKLTNNKNSHVPEYSGHELNGQAFSGGNDAENLMNLASCYP